MTWVVCATGPSLKREVVDSLKGRCQVVAVSDSYRWAPWADALASTDAGWWLANPEALDFEGKKFGAMPDFRAIEGVQRLPAGPHTNSGLLGIMTAVHLGAKRVLLLGFDLHSPGDHFFGRHKAPLKSTTPERMQIFRNQFAGYKPRGVKIINCTLDSALTCFPRGNLADCLAEPALLDG